MREILIIASIDIAGVIVAFIFILKACRATSPGA